MGTHFSDLIKDQWTQPKIICRKKVQNKIEIKFKKHIKLSNQAKISTVAAACFFVLEITLKNILNI
jgi:hypothetical protein